MCLQKAGGVDLSWGVCVLNYPVSAVYVLWGQKKKYRYLIFKFIRILTSEVRRMKSCTFLDTYVCFPIFARLDAGIVVSNPIRGMDVYVYVYVYCMFVLSCVGRGLAMS
jgi:hypothetical protein